MAWSPSGRGITPRVSAGGVRSSGKRPGATRIAARKLNSTSREAESSRPPPGSAVASCPKAAPAAAARAGARTAAAESSTGAFQQDRDPRVGGHPLHGGQAGRGVGLADGLELAFDEA